MADSANALVVEADGTVRLGLGRIGQTRRRPLCVFHVDNGRKFVTVGSIGMIFEPADTDFQLVAPVRAASGAAVALPKVFRMALRVFCGSQANACALRAAISRHMTSDAKITLPLSDISVWQTADRRRSTPHVVAASDTPLEMFDGTVRLTARSGGKPACVFRDNGTGAEYQSIGTPSTFVRELGASFPVFVRTVKLPAEDGDPAVVRVACRLCCRSHEDALALWEKVTQHMTADRAVSPLPDLSALQTAPQADVADEVAKLTLGADMQP